jgi:hypothetical protein
MALVLTCDDTLAVDRTDEPWFKPRKGSAAASALL